MQIEIRQAVLGYLMGQRPGKLLDIPSGSGWLGRELSAHGDWEYHPADLYAEGAGPNFMKADLNRGVPYEDESFDYVACLEGLEHIENYHNALREFARVLKPGGSLVISTPNPLNVKSRMRFLMSGTFYGFPHLVDVPPEGSHLHMTPVNLSFLISFARKYGLLFEKAHRVSAKPKNYRFLPHAFFLKNYSFIKTILKDKKKKEFMRQLTSLNVLLNDGMVVSFKKAPEIS